MVLPSFQATATLVTFTFWLLLLGTADCTSSIKALLPRACAVFFTHDESSEVLASIALLKELNPTVRTLLVSDKHGPAVLPNGSSVDLYHRIPTLANRGWASRLDYLASNMTQDMVARDCEVAIALDSRVAVCDEHLHERMADMLLSEGDDAELFAISADHAPYRPFYASPMSYFVDDHCEGSYGPTDGRSQHCHRYLPQQSGIIFAPRSARVKDLLRVWLETMKGEWEEDQRPLMHALEAQAFPSTRISESFALALKSVDQSRFGVFPRFSYVVEGRPVTLVHSFTKTNVPAKFNGSFCSFVNQEQHDNRPRMVWQSSSTADYELISSYNECMHRLSDFEPRLCRELPWKPTTTAAEVGLGERTYCRRRGYACNMGHMMCWETNEARCSAIGKDLVRPRFPALSWRRTILHAVSFLAKDDAFFEDTQLVTEATILAAKERAQAAGLGVEALNVVFGDDATTSAPPTPESSAATSIRNIRGLQRDAYDLFQMRRHFGLYSPRRKLPLLSDILESVEVAWHNGPFSENGDSPAKYVVFSNADVSVQPDFYEQLQDLIAAEDSLSKNISNLAYALVKANVPFRDPNTSRPFASHPLSPQSLEAAVALGRHARPPTPSNETQPHSFSCFMFPLAAIPFVRQLVHGVFVGFEPAGHALGGALQCLYPNYRVVAGGRADDSSWTTGNSSEAAPNLAFHIGTHRHNPGEVWRDYAIANRRRASDAVRRFQDLLIGSSPQYDSNEARMDAACLRAREALRNPADSMWGKLRQELREDKHELGHHRHRGYGGGEAAEDRDEGRTGSRTVTKKPNKRRYGPSQEQSRPYRRDQRPNGPPKSTGRRVGGGGGRNGRIVHHIRGPAAKKMRAIQQQKQKEKE